VSCAALAELLLHFEELLLRSRDALLDHAATIAADQRRLRAPARNCRRDGGDHPRRISFVSEGLNDIEGAALADVKCKMSPLPAGLRASARLCVHGLLRVVGRWPSYSFV
jgi:hypothetical protein